MRRDYADVVLVAKMRYRYSFEKPLTEEEIREAVLAGEYEDITDQEELEILEVLYVDMED